MRRRRRLPWARGAFAALALLLVAVAGTLRSTAQEPVRYRLSFPQPNHRWMQVEARFTALDRAPLHLRMSRASPGRYSLHDFAKNVYDVEAVGHDGRPLPLSRPDPYGWTVDAPGEAVTVRYKVFGDRVDGTYLAVDATHAHINMPAAVMWARGLEDRPAVMVFDAPSAARWQVATQLFPGAAANEFTAPNLQYLMDSPAEFGQFVLREFTADAHRFRVAVHHTGSDADVDRFVRDVERIVRAEGAVFGEYPAYDPGHYTFIADYLPYASGDGMEHRNSTVMTSEGTIRGNRDALLNTVAHEFFHGWNVERIRPRSLEPFDFERANMSGELWLAEGFTQYYAPLMLSRAGLADVQQTAADFGGMLSSVLLAPGRAVRSAEEMSRMAAFTDGGRTVDRTNWSDTYISYYPFGGAIALGLDLTLRERTAGRVTLDDYMRALWREYGKPGGTRVGFVDRPYTSADLQQRLGEISDAGFAREFFDRYVRGREVMDYARLLAQAGLLLRRSNAGTAWLGDLRLEERGGGVRLATAPAANTPLYAAGLDADDRIIELGGRPVARPEDVYAMVARARPGDTLPVVHADRSGAAKRSAIVLAESPHLEVVAAEAAGGVLSAAQKTFRSRWLGSGN